MSTSPEKLSDQLKHLEKNTALLVESLTGRITIDGVQRYCRWAVNGCTEAEFRTLLRKKNSLQQSASCTILPKKLLSGVSTIDKSNKIEFIDFFFMTKLREKKNCSLTITTSPFIGPIISIKTDAEISDVLPALMRPLFHGSTAVGSKEKDTPVNTATAAAIATAKQTTTAQPKKPITLMLNTKIEGDKAASSKSEIKPAVVSSTAAAKATSSAASPSSISKPVVASTAGSAASSSATPPTSAADAVARLRARRKK